MSAMAGLTHALASSASFGHDVGHWLGHTGVPILAILVVSTVLRFVIHRVIRRLVRRSVESSISERLEQHTATRVLATATGALHERRVQRTETLGTVLRSVSTALIYSIAFVMILDELSIPIAPLLASAGVAGVALGFGAQSLVKDFLSGIFMLVEDQYGVGDVIDAGEAIGTVEDVTLRITRLRDGNGVVWYVRNGEIVRVGNRSQGWSTALVDIPVAYTENIERVQEIVREALQQLDDDPDWHDRLVELPALAGIEQITGSTVTLRVIAKTQPNENLVVQREIRERVKVAFDANNVSVPVVFPPYGGGPVPPSTPGQPPKP
jgi:small conductance mechanosensitive channel